MKSEKMNVEYQLENKVWLKITFAADLEGDPAKIARKVGSLQDNHLQYIAGFKRMIKIK